MVALEDKDQEVAVEVHQLLAHQEIIMVMLVLVGVGQQILSQVHL